MSDTLSRLQQKAGSGSRLGRAALYLLRQDPTRWPRNETRFEDDLRSGLIDVLKFWSKRVRLSVESKTVEEKSIDFDGSKLIELLPQDVPSRKDPLSATEASQFKPHDQVQLRAEYECNLVESADEGGPGTTATQGQVKPTFEIHANWTKLTAGDPRDRVQNTLSDTT